MKRCVACGRAVDDDSGMAEYETCPWCGGAIAPDSAGARTLADALQVLWTVDSSLPYDAHAAELDMADLCPGLPASVSLDVHVAGKVGALALLRDGKYAGARRVLGDGAHWDEASVTSFVEAYRSLRDGEPPAMATVTFDPNGGLGGVLGPIECPVGGAVELPGPGALTRPGHSFAGWSREATGVNALTSGTSIEVAGNLTLHAAWERVAPSPPLPPPPATVTVAFDANGGGGKVPEPVTCRAGSEVELPGPGGLRRCGYRLAGWSRETSGINVLAPGTSIVARDDLTLHAAWEKATRSRWLLVLAAALAAVALIAWLVLRGSPVSDDGVPVRDGVADYSWSELKSLSGAIASAGSDADGLAIAKEYNLVDGDGRLRGDAKPVTLADETKTSVRVAGFRHDVLASGGVAGITFEFADSPANHGMNEKSTNAGGWEASGMRAWLNSDFLALLPDDLRTCVEPARKRTNNRGKVEEGDTSCVTETTDALWLLSSSEVYGSPSEAKWIATYDAEGTQYQFYNDKGATTQYHGFCKKSGTDSWWWLRSSNASNSTYFRLVTDDGDWLYSYADYDFGVSPGFCF